MEQGPRLLARELDAGLHPGMHREYIVGRKFQMKWHRSQLRPFDLVQLTQKLLMRWSHARHTHAVDDGLARHEQALLVVAAHARCPEFTREREHTLGARSARDQVAHEDHTVRRGGRDSSQKFLQLEGAAVYVTNPNGASHTAPIAGAARGAAGERPPLGHSNRTAAGLHPAPRSERTLAKREPENVLPPCRDGLPRFTVSASIPRFARQREAMTQFRFSHFCFAILAASALVGCGREEPKYEPVPAVTGSKAALPPVPNVPQRPEKDGDAYTVWGASYSLRNRVHTKEVADQELKVVGYIVKTNLMDAPACAVHEGGKADPDGCRPAVPTFWIADSKDADLKDAMKVMGWASNYANIYDAIKEYDKGKEDASHSDTTWGVNLPKPLPAVGAKVRVKGTYSTDFSMSSGGLEADPIMGIMTYKEIEYLEQAADLATLPGVKRKPPKS